MQYPKWRYHPECGGRIVKSEAEDIALGIGWVDSPLEFSDEYSDARNALLSEEGFKSYPWNREPSAVNVPILEAKEIKEEIAPVSKRRRR